MIRRGPAEEGGNISDFPRMPDLGLVMSSAFSICWEEEKIQNEKTIELLLIPIQMGGCFRGFRPLIHLSPKLSFLLSQIGI